MERLHGSRGSGHNSYIQIGVEMGLFGLIVYVSLFISSIFLCYSAQKISKHKDDYIYYIANGTMFGLISTKVAHAFWMNYIACTCGANQNKYTKLKPANKITDTPATKKYLNFDFFEEACDSKDIGLE